MHIGCGKRHNLLHSGRGLAIRPQVDVYGQRELDRLCGGGSKECECVIRVFGGLFEIAATA